ncbi:MAG TPA: hypothetical protein VJI75_06670 [Candidatus Nanoarchaeia archaeon]|nr:hypothetical protein [Candidatus Nanoarchaeia archaeon]
MKEGNDKLTISIDEHIKELFREICDKEGLKIGKQIELFMRVELKKRGMDPDSILAVNSSATNAASAAFTALSANNSSKKKNKGEEKW